jgi:CRP-like cAMP-binding protein
MAGNAVLAGDLSFISLADIFQILGGNNSTGTLHITSQHTSTPGLIHFANGNPINGATGPLHGIDAIYALFGWTEGNFRFHEENVQVKRVVNNSRMEIVLDALRMLDDGVIQKVGTAPPSDKVSAIHPGAAEEDRRDTMPVIKGPMVDYMYVMDEEEFRDGEEIITEGGHGNWIWAILEGMVKITKETSNGLITLAQLGEGCFIGAMASFLLRGHVRSATVTAVGEVQLGVLDTQRLAGEYASLSPDFRRLLLSLDGRLRKVTDRAVDLSLKTYKTNGFTNDKKLVLKEGSSKKDVYTIKEGKAYVIRNTSQGYLPLLTFEEGDVFGYVPFMDMGHEPRCASVLASKDLKVNKLDSEGLQKEYDQLSGTFRRLVDNVTTCVSLTTRLACHLREQETP